MPCGAVACTMQTPTVLYDVLRRSEEKPRRARYGPRPRRVVVKPIGNLPSGSQPLRGQVRVYRPHCEPKGQEATSLVVWVECPSVLVASPGSTSPHPQPLRGEEKAERASESLNGWWGRCQGCLFRFRGCHRGAFLARNKKEETNMGWDCRCPVVCPRMTMHGLAAGCPGQPTASLLPISTSKM